jgi:hypothetical protein
MRVFHDRLISDEDKAVFRGRVAELVQNRWGVAAPEAAVPVGVRVPSATNAVSPPADCEP